MQSQVAQRGVAYRPHAKSHKSPVIARMQIEAGARGICCSKLGEAEVMAADGIADIHITTPVVGARKASRLAELAADVRISVVADDAGNVAGLAAAARTRGVTIDVLVEADVGQGRCGVVAPEGALAVADAILRAPALRFKGLQGYQGKLQSVIAFDSRRDAV